MKTLDMLDKMGNKVLSIPFEKGNTFLDININGVLVAHLNCVIKEDSQNENEAMDKFVDYIDSKGYCFCGEYNCEPVKISDTYDEYMKYVRENGITDIYSIEEMVSFLKSMGVYIKKGFICFKTDKILQNK